MARIPCCGRCLRVFVVGTIVLAALGGALNDSGIAIPAFMFVVAVPYLSYLALSAAASEGPSGG